MKRFFLLMFTLILSFQLCFVSVSAAEPPAPNAESAILMHAETGKVLYEKNIHSKMYPASTTKILTALLLMETFKPEETIAVGDEINLVGLDSSMSGIIKGEELTIEELMWALLLPSGNDSSYTAAVQVARKKSGNASMPVQEAISYFSELMNKRARELGAKNSNFVNPDGYHDENHYSTAYDLALIAREAMKNELFRKIVSTYIYARKDTKNNNDLPWVNRNELINKNSKHYYANATGIKTGHTTPAGYSLVSSASKNGMDLIAVVLKDAAEESRWIDSKALFEYGFSNFGKHTILEKNQVVESVKVGKKHRKAVENLDVLSDSGFTDILNNDDVSKIKKEIRWNEELLSASKNNGEIKLLGPIEQGQVVGKVIYSLNGTPLAEANLLASRSVMKKDVIDVLISIGEQVYGVRFIILGILAGAFVLIVVSKTAASKKSRKRRLKF